MRGLKSTDADLINFMIESHLARGAWIEILIVPLNLMFCKGRTSQEVRGLKSVYFHSVGSPSVSRTLQEVRGLKSNGM